jgi:hypothetical protein
MSISRQNLGPYGVVSIFDLAETNFIAQRAATSQRSAFCRMLRRVPILFSLLLALASVASAGPSPVLTSVFPPGGQAGTTVEVTIAGTGLVDVSTLYSSQIEITCEKDPGKKDVFRLTIPPGTLTGQYDLYAVTKTGLSSPRVFVVGNRAEVLEVESDSPQRAHLDCTINGRIQKGDIDTFTFAARRGQRVIIECSANRIDSQLRAMLELFDPTGRQQGASRGFFGVDPLIDFTAQTDGQYVIKLYDLIYSGSNDHFYRLDIDTRPRPYFTVPAVVQAGQSTTVSVFGWNLTARSDRTDHTSTTLDRIDVEVTAPLTRDLSTSGLRLLSNQVTVNSFALRIPDGHAPIALPVTDIPVHLESSVESSPASSIPLQIPSEITGQLVGGAERDWFSFTARRGEVLWLEAFGERIGSPVDLDLTVLGDLADVELARFTDEAASLGEARFPSSHSDPAGRFRVPSDGRYLVLVRSLTGDLDDNPRRVYRLSIRREDPALHVAVLTASDKPCAITLEQNGRTLLDLVAWRNRGLTGSVRVFATELPPGVHCPEVWLGPGVTHTSLVLSATDSAAPIVGRLTLSAEADDVPPQRVRQGVIIRDRHPTGRSRITDSLVLSIADESPIKLTASGNEPRRHHLFGDMPVRHSPGEILDIAVQVDRQDPSHQPAVTLTGVGLPDTLTNILTEIPAGQKKGTLSLYLPPTLQPGMYTVAVEGRTTIPTGPPTDQGPRKTASVTIFSNPVTFEVLPPAFVVKLDPSNPTQIRRGETIQIKYSAKRINGFISKIHTELYSDTEEVDGLRGRGVTFVGQTDSGTIQIIANENARIGTRPFLRLFAVGVVEDKPVYHGSCFLPLEVVE